MIATRTARHGGVASRDASSPILLGGSTRRGLFYGQTGAPCDGADLRAGTTTRLPLRVLPVFSKETR